MKVTIKQWNAVAAWRWDMPEDDVCGICRSPYDSTCSKCRFPGDECPLLIGECNHSFHMHCIIAWVQQEQSQERCPMCRSVWKEKGAVAAMDIKLGNLLNGKWRGWVSRWGYGFNYELRKQGVHEILKDTQTSEETATRKHSSVTV
ncbi:zinc ion binding [Venturia nashicola]|uniref:Anaphase-promoting complex subunit 11 n=1 Tax=Venturia nashicola TaxID=86259 RepID=A0A4Z1NI03_9PEZI|nr:zinc ion binding [Venturia nashicola]